MSDFYKDKKTISVVTSCFNEEENVEELFRSIEKVFQDNPRYMFEVIFMDNASTDSTASVLRRIASSDKRVKVILNAKNFGHIRSPYHGLLQTKGDAVVMMASDLQDPPEMIADFVKAWENGADIVVGIKDKSKEGPLMFLVRRVFYYLSHKMSETDYIKNFTGFGLYDKKFVDVLRGLDEPYPYLRGLVAQFGSNIEKIRFTQPKRKAGRTKNNFYTLYDMAMLGFVNHSKIPIRLASFIGFTGAFMSFMVAIAYFAYKLIYWKSFEAGVAPLVIGFFFVSSIQLLFIGIIGEYISSIYTQVKNQPLVIEKERINFEETDTKTLGQ
ncbi:glycosyltransferase family 2 protein [Candidatus Microgenomates bacterium]|nr:glycosyltransferase family 2 protein [Candidatus Microgenomates bacterium]